MTETLRQWMIDMTGPEDAFAATQLREIVEPAWEVVNIHDAKFLDLPALFDCLEKLRKALINAGYPERK